MTTTEPRTRGAAKAPQQPAGLLMTQPQVNLLPPEVRTARGLRSTKRLLGIVLVGVVLLCGGGYVLATTVEQSAQDRMTEADSTTADLQAEAQQYAELPRVQDEIDRVSAARSYGMGPDVEWTGYIGAVAVLLPPDARIEAFTMTMGNPVEAPADAADPLEPGDAVGRLEVVGRTVVLPDTAAWMDALAQVPGFSDPRVSSAQTAEDDGSTFYRVTVSVRVMPDAYSGRFDGDAQQEEG